ncbi:MAG: DNA-directed RNA polymerase subunit beta, partial [Bacillota bacterium]
MSQKIHKIKCGKVDRWSFSQIEPILEIPYLIEVQKNSYEKFVNQGIREVFDDFSPITDYSGKMELEFLEHTLEGTCKYSVKECKDRDITYTSPLKVKVRLTIKETGEMKEQTVFMGDFPKMTDKGTFIINGAERVVVSQLVRSPGVYTKGSPDKNGVMRYDTTVIPNRGAWLEFEQDANNILSVRVDRNRKITSTILLRALGYGSNEDLQELFDKDEMIEATAMKDGDILSAEAAKIEVYRRLKPGEVPTANAVDVLLPNIFFDAKRYDLSRVGRYKFNKKLSVAERIEKQVLARDVVADGEILAEKGQEVDRQTAKNIQDSGINVVYIVTPDGKEYKVIGNNTVDLAAYIDCDPKELGILEKVYYPKLVELLELYGEDKEALKKAITENIDELVLKHISKDDIVAAVSYNLGMKYEFSQVDNIDHLSNRRVRSVG